MKGKVSKVFLTHPDRDHISYLYDLYTWPSNPRNPKRNKYKEGNGLSKETSLYVGGSSSDWEHNGMTKEIKNLFGNKINYYTRDQFTGKKTHNIPFCWNLMNMEILYAHGTSSSSNIEKNEKSL